MKLLQNPIVVGALVVLAAAMVFYNAIWPSMKRRGWGASRPKPAAPLTQGMKAAVNPQAAAEKMASGKSQPQKTPVKTLDKAPASAEPPPAPVTALAPIETSVVWASSARWREAPHRDPFHSRLYDVKIDPNARAAKELLVLKGIWQQDGYNGMLAVINQQVVGVGDQIQGYTVDAIEYSRVWVQGPRGREELTFTLIVPQAPESLPETPENISVESSLPSPPPASVTVETL